MPRKKTFKEQKDLRETHDLWKANREGKKPPEVKGGHTNLLREAAEDLVDFDDEILEELDA